MLNKNKLDNWYNKFKTNIKLENKKELLYIINKEFFNSSSNKHNLNAKILNKSKVLEVENNFDIINIDIWQMIKKNYPNEEEIMADGNYDNKKYFFQISPYIYYFYFINDYDKLTEGYFKFQHYQEGSKIINEFIFLNIYDFFNKFHIKENNDLQNFKFESSFFLFKIKTKFNQNNNNINKQNINININNINNNHNNKIHNNGFNNNKFNLNNNKNFFPTQKNINKVHDINKPNNQNNQNNQIKFNNNNNFISPNLNIQNNVLNNNKNNNKNVINNINNNNNQINNKNINNQNRPRPASADKLKIDKNQVKIPRNFTAGLENVGATCYMNATLQCLAHVKNLTNYLLKPEKIQKIQKNILRNKLTSAYLNVLSNLWQNVNIAHYAPNHFKQVISEMNPLFKGIQANDSKDLILFLLETMHNELNKSINPNLKQNNELVNQFDFNESLKSFRKFFMNNYRSVISNLFYGLFNSIMICKKCKIMTHNIQCYNILIFPLEEVRKYKKKAQNVVNIEECFEYYQKQETMTGQNQIYCNNCKSMSDSINYSQLITSPYNLIINLNRGKGLQFNIKINFEEYLDINNFLHLKDKKDIPTFYELIGIVTHFGPSSMSGHFIAFCKSFVDGKWYKYNDAIVSTSSFNEVKNTGVPYILFYSALKN